MTTPALFDKHTPAWRIQVWLAFVVSLVALIAGVLFIDVSMWERAFLLLGTIFSVSSTLALAKTVRDDHEAQKVLTRADAARTEKLINEFAA